MISTVLALALLASPAIAQDTPGIERLAKDASFVPPASGWFLPDSYYDQCLIKATQLRIVQGVADECIDETEQRLQPIQAALMEAQGRIVLDGQELGRMEGVLGVKDSQIESLRSQRNTAFGIAGGSVLTVAAGVVVAVLVSR